MHKLNREKSIEMRNITTLRLNIINFFNKIEHRKLLTAGTFLGLLDFTISKLPQGPALSQRVVKNKYNERLRVKFISAAIYIWECF